MCRKINGTIHRNYVVFICSWSDQINIVYNYFRLVKKLSSWSHDRSGGSQLTNPYISHSRHPFASGSSPFLHSVDGDGDSCEVPEVSWARATEECGWVNWDLLMTRWRSSLCWQLNSKVCPSPLVWFKTIKADLQQRLQQGRCWPVLGTSSINSWSIVSGLRVDSCRWQVLQKGWYVWVEWDPIWTREPPSEGDAEE